VRAILDLLRSDIPVHGLAHITGGGARNLLRLTHNAGFAIEDPLPVPPIIDLVIERAGVSPHEAWEVFNMGCGFVVVVPEQHAPDATALLAAHHPGTRRVGTATDRPGVTVGDLRY
jgi:phosphoribosylformylglycinamidine cyclo-ligase